MKLIAVRGSPLIGMYVKASENFTIVGINDEQLIESIERELKTDVIVTSIAGSELVGALIAINSQGAVVSKNVLSREIDVLSRHLEVKIIDTPMTCFGNNLCVNDKGGIANPEMSERVLREVSDFLDVEIVKGTVGGIKTVGMAAVVTNRGGLVNPNANDWELKRIKDVLHVEVQKGTVNFGNDMVGSSLVANSKGYLVGRDTTGFELGMVEEALFP
ncbi:translation initiation factor IF-6 [Archaeoglobales archaeon]|nr:MAG: translation initiation factor 6 [Archaeoglobales archaeon ex4484_92]RLI83745.1 MAG: translation initiation factor IF-6 [Archaeoglobales archaeon]